MAKKLLEIKNLTTVFSDKINPKVALSNISMDIPEQSMIGLVGQSGSGKSITAMSILQLLYNKNHTTTGEILYKGQNLLELSWKQLTDIRGNHISMIFQEPMTSLNPVYTVGHQVEEQLKKQNLRNAKERYTHVLEVFSQMGIQDPERCYHSYPHELSGGLRQRVMIAMAMISNPELLIADEPTTALDVTIQAQILEQLHELKEFYHTSVLLITHDLGIVSNYCDYVYVMYNGQIVEQGKTTNVLQNPSHPYTKELMNARFTIPQNFRFEQKDRHITSTSDSDFCRKQQPILDIRNLNRTFGSNKSFGSYKKPFHANKNINLSLYPGEMLALIGESGSGKSTLGYQIAGLLQPTSGEIYYKGREITSLSGKEKHSLHKEIQIVFQDPLASLDPSMDVFHLIEEPLLVHKLYPNKEERRKQVLQMMEQVGLESDLSSRLPSQLSGGQRQRIGIARALIMRPSIIVWDEPVSALDVMLERQIIDLIQTLQKLYGFSSIFITHDMSLVYHIAHRACVMKDGEIVEVSPVQEIFTSPKSDYTKQLIDSIL